MRILTLNDNSMDMNSYLMYDEDTRKGVLIDAGLDSYGIISTLRIKNIELKGIIQTHGHFDHMASLDEVRDVSNAPAYIHANDADMLNDTRKNLSVFVVRMEVIARPAEYTVGDGMVLPLAGFSFRIMHTPGHSPGSICIAEDDYKILFTGDTLFNGSIGRMDFPGADIDSMKRSLESIICLDGGYKVYPGHGMTTTIEKEKAGNPYINGTVLL